LIDPSVEEEGGGIEGESKVLDLDLPSSVQAAGKLLEEAA
jgi:hypothetical protein